MSQLYDNPDQEALHLKAMQALALETGHEFALVRQVYEVELTRLRTAARVAAFVLLRSSRRARETLRKPATPVQSEPVTA